MLARLLARRRWSGVVVRSLWGLCAIAALRPSQAGGQDIGIGRIDEIRGLDTRASCLTPASTGGDRQLVSRVRNGTDEPAWTQDAVLVNDRLIVGRRTDVRVAVEAQRFGKGNFFLAPEIGRCQGSELARAVPSLKDARGRGSYEFRTDAVGAGRTARDRLILDIRNGAAVVQWQAGLLSVRALGETISDTGTVFTVVVDSESRRGIVSVHEGVVTMRAVRAIAGQALTFGTGRPVQAVEVGSSAIQEAYFHTADVWRASTAETWKSRVANAWSARPAMPWKWVGGVAGAAAGVFLVRKAVDVVNPPPKPEVPPLRPVVIVVIPL